MKYVCLLVIIAAMSGCEASRVRGDWHHAGDVCVQDLRLTGDDTYILRRSCGALGTSFMCANYTVDDGKVILSDVRIIGSKSFLGMAAKVKAALSDEKAVRYSYTIDKDENLVLIGPNGEGTTWKKGRSTDIDAPLDESICGEEQTPDAATGPTS